MKIICNIVQKYICISVLFLCFASSFNAYAQDKKEAKPKMIFIVDGKEVTEEYLMVLQKEKKIKAMHNGVSKKEKKTIVKRFKERLDNNFVMKIEVFSEEEILVNKEKQPAKSKSKSKEVKVAKKEAVAASKIKVGDTITAFALEDIHGNLLKKADLKGKVVLLNFWATWCVPCLREFYEVPAVILEPNKGKDFLFIPVSVGEKRSTVLKKMGELKGKGVDFNVYLDLKNEFYSAYRKQGIPLNYLIDKNGVIVDISVGYNEDNLNKIATKIEELIE
ncbi:TlpA family protein disulfide reductase [Cellulophaga fucicola]|uniref:Cytochrome oxidase Cu insertion factor, SCO1/SenC/PrrC family n=1 Tax=Cellulophaga fucicola TaxID=76595 RepID=A0A1K1PRB5_9FLAO|nr:TlpA disulfide reductase family protein [Cellulophaga fucicola]SFW49310.1 Cytochrome oxidase Cu insertion factor, SCO1/SenC/PrrC family [Cellulophaga fucicola]